MALAQLKLQQLKIRQTFKEKEQELKRSKQLTEAEMEITRAAVFLEIYQRAEEEKNCESKVNQEQLLQTDLSRREEIAAGQEASRITEQSRENTNCTKREKMLAATSQERPPAHSNEILSGLLDGQYLHEKSVPLVNVLLKTNDLSDQTETTSIHSGRYQAFVPSTETIYK